MSKPSPGPLGIWNFGVGGCLFYIYLFLMEVYLLYSIMLGSTKHKQESAIDLPMSPPHEHPSQVPAHPTLLGCY